MILPGGTYIARSIIESAGVTVLNVGQSSQLTSVMLLRFALAMLVAVSLALVTYQVIEVPARRWLRSLLTMKLQTPAIAPALTRQP